MPHTPASLPDTANVAAVTDEEATAPIGAETPSPPEDLQRLVDARRQHLPPPDRPADGEAAWGLALSGGGIRSATFCFGLLKALGQNRVLHRFDLLSTVSGGGYIGSTVGKLFQNARISGQGPREVEAALGDADRRWFAFWLRANGRYLIPRGSMDAFFAAANFGRNLVGVHIELALLALLLGGLLVGFDLSVWAWADCIFSSETCWRPGWVSVQTLAALSPWPTLWMLLPPAVWWGAVMATAYWTLPAKAGQGLTAQRWKIAALSLAGAIALARYWSGAQDGGPMAADDGLQVPALLMLATGGMLLAWVAGTLVAWRMTQAAGSEPDVSRNRLTGALAGTLKVGLAIFGLGLVDRLAWTLANASVEGHGAAGVVIGLSVVVLRAVLPKISDLPRSLTPGTRNNLMGLINLAGLAAMLLLTVFWISLVHRGATLSLFDEQRRSLQYALSWRWLAVLVLPPLVMVVVSFRNREFLNRSSLYAFYRARLVRSYLGAANGQRFQAGDTDPTALYPHHLAGEGPQVAVQDVHHGDDVPMADYQPHLAGGPVHLINVCVNQTRDPRGGLFNQDRKGLLMTVGPQGRVRVDRDHWRTVDDGGGMSLGAWVAISGAAVAPGLGSSTRSGMAALLTLAGIRLGYWWDSSVLQRRDGDRLPPTVGKYGQLLSELQGRFDGTQRRDWFLSDGGHFENTAAYALLREECKLIVVADCGADPRYAFGDLENLVRKARIDLQAEITFLKPRLLQAAAPNPAPGPAAPRVDDADRSPAPPPAPAPATAATRTDAPPLRVPREFGSLNDLASADSHACLALARVRYGNGKVGHLVIVKPNMCEGVSVDLVNFKADNPLFPQEPTTDQFFSETQWESYFQLGNMLGRRLDQHFLSHVGDYAESCFEDDDGSVAAVDADGKVHNVAAPKRLPSRIAATGAVTASISLGALATLGATAWQAVDGQLQAIDKARRVDPAVLKELTDLYGKLAPGTPASGAAGEQSAEALKDTRLGEMATALLRISDAACTGTNTQAFKQSALMQMILSNTKKSCAASSSKHPACEVLLNDDEIVSCLREETRINCVPQYWIRDYGAADLTKLNCQPPPVAAVTEALPTDGVQESYGLQNSLGGLMADAYDWLAARLPRFGGEDAPPPPPPPPPLPSASIDEPASAPVTGTPASGPSTPPGPTQPEPAPNPLACSGKTIYIQIFGPELRDRVRLLRDPWRALGASVPPVEDVWDSARRAGRTPPQAPAQPNVIYHDEASLACARELEPKDTGAAWSVAPLSQRLKGTPGVIEVWIPPPARSVDGPSTGATANGLPASGFCYQEDTGTPGAQRYGVHCHVDLPRCDSARGPNPKRKQSTCQPVDLTGARQVLQLRGWGGSWYAMQGQPFGAPFPRLPEGTATP